MRAEIAKITRNIGATTILRYPRPKQKLRTLADRIVIMSSTKNPDGSWYYRSYRTNWVPPQELYNGAS